MTFEGLRVAVIDDIPAYANSAAGIVEEAELTPAIISEGHGTFDCFDQLLAKVSDANCKAVVCDHRLSNTGFAPFTGAAFVADLYQRKIPAVLTSAFSEIDSLTSIRLHRAFIPSLIPRKSLHPDQILQGLNLCFEEFKGRIAPHRVSRRTLVRIVEVSMEGAVPVADAIMHSWDPDQAIRFPIQLIENAAVKAALEQGIQGELRLFAQVNVGCQSETDLFLHDFEFAPDPDIEALRG